MWQFKKEKEKIIKLARFSEVLWLCCDIMTIELLEKVDLHKINKTKWMQLRCYIKMVKD